MSIEVPVNPTPKARFMSSKEDCTVHRNLMQSDELQKSLDYALLEYQRRLANTQTGESGIGAAACHFKSVGALEFLNVLRRLAESEPVPKMETGRNLNHNV